MMPASAAETRSLFPARRWLAWGYGLLLLAGTFLVYGPCLHGGFLWDDDAWTSQRHALYESPTALWRIWTDFTALQQYYPLTGTTFWIDHHLWGEWTLPYHVQNVGWHAVAAVLFWRVLVALRVPGAWLAGGFLAWHPVMVESVAWIAERKNVLSLALFLAAVLCYVRFAAGWEGERPRGARRYYWGSFLFFTGALLAKVTAYVFPPTILLLCWWKRGRISRREVVAMLPFLALAVGVGLIVSWVERVHVGAEGADWEMSPAQRVLLAGRALCFYVGKLLWPQDLAFMYPRWPLDPASPAAWLYPAFVVLVAGGLWFFRRRIGRGVFAAVFFFAGTIFPVLGFLNVYGMRFASVADHWVYVPSLAVFALVAAGLAQVAQRQRWPWLLPVTAAVVWPLLGWRAWCEAAQYRDVETLWQTTMAKSPGHWMPHYQLGLHQTAAGRPDQALPYFLRTAELRPGDAMLHNNIGTALTGLGRHEEAVAAYRKALGLGARSPIVRFNLGNALVRTGRTDEAILELREALAEEPGQATYHYSLAAAYVQKGWPEEARASYRQVLALEPDHALAHFALGNLLLKSGDLDRAGTHYRRAIAAQPGMALAHANLGVVALRQGDFAAAIESLRHAVELHPRGAAVWTNLALAHFHAGQFAEALAAFTEAMRIEPDSVAALMNAAWLLAVTPDDAVRDGPRALPLAARAEQLTAGRDLSVLRALAAAYAENHEFAKAADAIRRAQKIAAALQAGPDLVALLDEELALYRSEKPRRSAAPL